MPLSISKLMQPLFQLYQRVAVSVTTTSKRQNNPSMAADINKVTEAVICAELNKPITKEIPQSGKKDIVKHVEDYPYDAIDKINKKNEIWRLGVIIDDKWIVLKGEAEESLQIVIRDIKGNNIQATVMDKDIEYWKPKLAEGKTYCMRNFKIYDNNTGFKMSAHKYKLMFVGATRVDELEIAGIPQTLHNFVDFTDIVAGKFTPDLLVDAIGVIDSIKKVVTASSTKKGNVAFTLKDMRDNVIDCTLWDSHAIQFLNHYNQQADLGPVVLIIKHAKVKPAQEMYPIQLTNAWYGTKMLFVKEIPEITAFIASLPKDRSYPTQSYRVSNSSQWFSQTSGGSQYNADEIFMKGARILPIAEIKKLKKETFCVTVATTSHIRVSNQGWFFRGCHDCSFKADGNEPPFTCRDGHTTDDPIIKYKLDVEVYDGDHTAKFVFWDNTLEELIGMTAKTLLEKQTQLGLGDPQDYPQHMDSIMERKFVFRVKWQSTWGGQGSVIFCRDNKELVAKIEEQLPGAESSLKAIESSIEDVVALNDSTPIQIFDQTDIEKFASLDDSILSTQNISASASVSADIEVSGSSHKTPAKRSAAKNTSVDHNNLEAQFSSTRYFSTNAKAHDNMRMYAELPPEFVNQYNSVLPNSVELWEINGIQNYVTLNKDHSVPRFTIGWDEVLNHYHINRVKLIYFIYCGGAVFWISVGNPLTHTDEYPSFHSLSTKPDLAVYFDVVLSKYTAVSSQLNLRKEFGDYIRSTGWNHVLLCNKDFNVQQASILLRGHPNMTSKIGSGWKIFCTREGYKDGDTIRFKFAKSQSVNLVHVRKVSSNS
ncbi:hypothetical protein TSUD_280680 [Trifolium subterraneum]|uniref:TF-B3 domain-containing protein n=1 Tax=Trifolium subterraneum TaxID=3900 RepID=A0A2Z6NQD5_TRISU|nr:hypothetical protein TSUD_280680 [Trifolium subterraneum]